jgi:quercetin dioxygenase-like cupin family protein
VIQVKTYVDREFFPESSFPFFIDRYTIRKGETIPSHSHSFYELVYVVEGNARHEMLGIAYELKPGDVFIIEPDVSHCYQGHFGQETVVFNIMFKLELLRDQLNGLSGIPEFVDFFYLAPFLRKSSEFCPYVSVSGRVKNQLESKLLMMEFEVANRSPGYRLIVKTAHMESAPFSFIGQ